jgi:peptidyl-prolyl cis-trans isomerase SurA
MRFKGTFRMVLACAILVSGTALAETIDRIVAVVNGDIILYSELQNRVREIEKLSSEAKTADPAQRGQLEREVLHRLIQQRLTDGEIKRLKITVSAGEVDNAIQTIKRQNNFSDAQFDYFISQEGQTLDQFREKIKKELERNRLLDRVVKSKTIITDAQVDAYVQSGTSKVADQMKIAILFLKRGSADTNNEAVEKRAREVLSRLKEGADFSRMVKEYSEGPAVQDGGDIGYVSLEDLAPPIQAATRGLGSNQITDVVKTSGGCYIIKVLDVRREVAKTGDSTTREKLHRKLFQEEMNRKFEAWLKELEDQAFIQVFL